jgi:hypothetical protein
MSRWQSCTSKCQGCCLNGRSESLTDNDCRHQLRLRWPSCHSMELCCVVAHQRHRLCQWHGVHRHLGAETKGRVSVQVSSNTPSDRHFEQPRSKTCSAQWQQKVSNLGEQQDWRMARLGLPVRKGGSGTRTCGRRCRTEAPVIVADRIVRSVTLCMCVALQHPDRLS